MPERDMSSARKSICIPRRACCFSTGSRPVGWRWGKFSLTGIFAGSWICRLGGKLVARERYDLDPEDDSLEALQAKFPAAHYLSVYAAGAMAANWPAEALDALSGEDVYLGHGPLNGGVHVIRALCRDSLAARRLLETLRLELYAAADRKPPFLGRIFF